MKVWVFKRDVVYEYDCIDNTVKVFSSRDKAIAALKAWRDDEMQYVRRDNLDVEEDTEERFEAYLDGYYSVHHTIGEVVECDVE